MPWSDDSEEFYAIGPGIYIGWSIFGRDYSKRQRHTEGCMHQHYLNFGSALSFLFLFEADFSFIPLLLFILSLTYETFLLSVHVISYSSYTAISC